LASKGVVLFALNNGGIDYVKIAAFAAERVRKYLEVPISIVTDSPDWLHESCPDHCFDQIIVHNEEPRSVKEFHDGSIFSKKLDWKNFSRSKIYELTPYDKTLVIDSDYIINSSMLKLAFDKDADFQIYKGGFDLAGWRDQKPFIRLNSYSIPFYWATAFVFEKNQITESFFDLIEYIKFNWHYYRILYNIDSTAFRNDFAFSIAIHIMNGKTDGGFATDLPGTMVYTLDRDILVSIENTTMKFLVEKESHRGEYILSKTTGLDVHVMNKFSLSRFIDGGSGV
jgi:hypothetical protein